MIELPRYKSREYYATFKMEWKLNDMIEKFKKDGELTAETKVTVKNGNYYGKTGKSIYWGRKTLRGKEIIYLGCICPTDGFLEFLDIFTEKKGFFLKRWETTYGIIHTVSRLCQSDPDKFKKLVREAKNVDELIIASGFRD